MVWIPVAEGDNFVMLDRLMGIIQKPTLRY